MSFNQDFQTMQLVVTGKQAYIAMAVFYTHLYACEENIYPSGDTGTCMSVVTKVKYHPTPTAAGAKCVSKRDYRK